MTKYSFFKALDNADTGIISSKILADEVELQQHDFLAKHVAHISEKCMRIFIVCNIAILGLVLFRVGYLLLKGYAFLDVDRLINPHNCVPLIWSLALAILFLLLFMAFPECCFDENRSGLHVGSGFQRKFVCYTFVGSVVWLMVMFLYRQKIYYVMPGINSLEPALTVLIPLSYIGAILVIPYFSAAMLSCFFLLLWTGVNVDNFLLFVVLIGFLAGCIATIFYFIRRTVNYIARVEFNNYQMTSKLVRSLNQDLLLAIPNRQAFFTSVANRLRRKDPLRSPGAAILMVDVDHFKKYNDHYGHPAGDRCLQQVAACLSSAIRDDLDMVGRYGGEEFIVYLDDVDAQGAVVVTERLQQQMAQLGLAHARSTTADHVTLSIGITLWQPGATLTELCEQADKALYRAKQTGRNRYVLQALTDGCGSTAGSPA